MVGGAHPTNFLCVLRVFASLRLCVDMQFQSFDVGQSSFGTVILHQACNVH